MRRLPCHGAPHGLQASDSALSGSCRGSSRVWHVGSIWCRQAILGRCRSMPLDATARQSVPRAAHFDTLNKSFHVNSWDCPSCTCNTAHYSNRRSDGMPGMWLLGRCAALRGEPRHLSLCFPQGDGFGFGHSHSHGRLDLKPRNPGMGQVSKNRHLSSMHGLWSATHASLFCSPHPPAASQPGTEDRRQNPWCSCPLLWTVSAHALPQNTACPCCPH